MLQWIPDARVRSKLKLLQTFRTWPRRIRTAIPVALPPLRHNGAPA